MSSIPGLRSLTLVLLALVLPAAAQAVIVSTSGSPRASVIAGPFGDVTRNVTWNVRADDQVQITTPFSPVPFNPSFGPPTVSLAVLEQQISSPGGVIMIDRGPGTGLAQLAPLEPQIGLSVTFNETVTLPQQVIEQAQRAGARRILIVRTFQQTAILQRTVTAAFLANPVIEQQQSLSQRQEAIAFFLSPSGVGGPFSVFRTRLRFRDGAPFLILQPNEPARPYADIFYRGTGRLEGVWEIAEPASTSGALVWRPLERVVRLLGAGQRLTVRGPKLPNLVHGLYLVRFNILGPGGAPEDPIIRYQVLAGASRYVQLALSSPPPESRIDRATSFAWGEAKDAVAYRMEFYEKRRGRGRYFDEGSETFGDLAGPGSQPLPFESSALDQVDADEVRNGRRVTGLLVPAEERATELSEMVWEALVPGREYWVQIFAVNDQGAEIGSTEPRRIRVALPEAPAP